MTLEAVHADPFAAGWTAGWTPDPDYTVSQWAAAHRMLSSKASAEPGPWRNERTPYLVEPMDALSPHDPCERVVLMFASQTGKTECGNNWIGFNIHHAPGPMLLVQPTDGMLKKNVRQRIDPMIADTPELRALVGAVNGKQGGARARDAANSMFMKEFPGGMLLATGANSAASLASMPIRYFFGDEIDRWPGDVDGEGDPVALAEKRLTTFRRRKALLTATPTLKGFSRVETEYDQSDKRHYHVPCPHCFQLQALRFRDKEPDGKPGAFRLVWQQDAGGRPVPGSTRYRCEHCGEEIEERFKTWMLDPANGARWIASATGDGRTKGYHLNGLYSPLGWKSWDDVAMDFYKAKDKPEALKTFVNTVLAETYDVAGYTVEADTLEARRETYWGEEFDVPGDAALVTCSVDVQDDRLEAKLKAWGAEEESWLIACEQFLGDPGKAGPGSVWEQLDTFRRQVLRHETGAKLAVRITLIDSGGHHTDDVYRYCAARKQERVFPLKGVPGAREILGLPSRTNKYRVALFPVGTDPAKDRIYARLGITRPGPGYLHLPLWADKEYLEQLTSEKAIKKYQRGRGTIRVWEKIRERNEALDLEVYALAALYALGKTVVAGLAAEVARLKAGGKGGPTPPPTGGTPPTSGTTTNPPKALARRRTGWVNRY